MIFNVGTRRFCVYIQNHIKLVILKKNWTKMQTDMNTQKKKNNDTNDEETKDIFTDPTLEGVALRMKKLLEEIQEESISRRMFLMQHTNAIQ